MNNITKFLIGALVMLIALWLVQGAFATQNDNVRICHKNNGNGWSNITVDDDAVNGFGGGDHNTSQHQNGQDIIPPGEWDENGRNWTQQNQAIWNNECNAVQPTATPTMVPPTATPILEPTVTPTSTPEPTVTEVEPTPTEEPEVTPEPTREVTPTVSTPQVVVERVEVLRNDTTSTPSCPDLQPTKVMDGWYTDYKIENGEASLTIHWGTNSNYQKAHIVYGENKGEWRYGKLNVDNDGTDTIEHLKPHQTYWFQIAYVQGCAVGSYSEPFDP